MKRIALSLLFFPSLAFASATNVYISQAGAGTQDGTSAGNAAPYSVLNTTNANGGCGSGANQVGPGTVVHLLSETDTFAAGATPITVSTSCQGASGNPITLQATLPLVWQSAYFNNANGALVASGVSYLVIDGQGGNCGYVDGAVVNCTGWDIHNTANGSWLANQQSSRGIVCEGCVGLEVKGMYIHDIYDHKAPYAIQSCTGSGTTQTCQISGQPFTANNQYISIILTSSTNCDHTNGSLLSQITSFTSTAVTLTNTDGVSCASSTGGYIVEYNIGYNEAMTILFSGNGANIHNNQILHNGGGIWANENVANSTRQIHNNDVGYTCAGLVEAGALTSGTGGAAYWYGNYVHDFSDWDTGVSTGDNDINGCHEDGIHVYGSTTNAPFPLFFYNNVMDATNGGFNMNSPIFIESAGGSEWSGTNTAMLYFFNNVCLGNDSTLPQGSNCIQGGGLEGASQNNTLAANNTVLCQTNVPAGGRIGYGLTGSDVIFKNNAAQDCGAIMEWNGFTIATPSTDLNNNAYARTATCSGNGCYNWGSHSPTISATTLAAWQTASSGDANAVENTTGLGLGSNYKPSSTSSLVYQAGQNLYSICNGQPVPGLGALCYDAAGVARPSTGAWDAGAYQYSGTPPWTHPPMSRKAAILLGEAQTSTNDLGGAQ